MKNDATALTLLPLFRISFKVSFCGTLVSIISNRHASILGLVAKRLKATPGSLSGSSCGSGVWTWVGWSPAQNHSVGQGYELL